MSQALPSNPFPIPSPQTRAKDSIVPLSQQDEQLDWVSSIGFLAMHLAAFSVFFVGFSWAAFLGLLLTYSLRVFSITAGYHRYFAHRSFKTTRWFQFFLAFMAGASAQMGALWWAAHHRHHHRFSDTEHDIHSPIRKGFFWSHMGWVLSHKYVETNYKAIPDFAKYPELVFLNKYHLVPPVILALTCLGVGYWLGVAFPELGTNGLQMLCWAFFFSTLLVYHATFTVNSLTHVFGNRRFNTRDGSRNNWLVAIITFGEGWHNNHHRYPSSERQGIYWWEVDVTHYIIKALSYVGVTWDIRETPKEIFEEAQEGRTEKLTA